MEMRFVLKGFDPFITRQYDGLPISTTEIDSSRQPAILTFRSYGEVVVIKIETYGLTAYVS